MLIGFSPSRVPISGASSLGGPMQAIANCRWAGAQPCDRESK